MSKNEEDYQNLLCNDDPISPEVENSYIQQNLPIRRQSLIVYHDKLKAESEQEIEEQEIEEQPHIRKRHLSLNFTCFYRTEKQPITRLYSSKSLTAIYDLSPTNQQKDQSKNRAKHPSLSIQISQPDVRSATSINSSTNSSTSSNYSPFEFSMDTLFEEQQLDLQPEQAPKQQQQQQPIPRFIGNVI
jgi:hypothetical protein